MKRHPRNPVKCKKCHGEVRCSTCSEIIYPSTEFSDWLRSRDGYLSSVNYSNQNLDYIWHNYRQNWFITIEEKRYGAHSSEAQKDTHGMVAQLLQYSSGCPIINSVRNKEVRTEYRGHYEITFSQTSPDDSDWITINSSPANMAMLTKILIRGTP